ncbi:GNAT family N-acetyltransferase [Dysgonomonas massiliensis]|uniref:GNAT family N-acetyltransferase n=1 Tax=Dysgonomonas massiliensis TaxID=2040292 RepID=UPI000C761B4D|nr:GNAT family N-acetyltransferase [Dysgonomonas massiliensis]
MTVNEANYEDVLRIRQLALYPDKDIDFVKLPDDEQGIHMGVYDGGTVVAVVSIFMAADRSVQFRKLSVLPQAQGRGYGSTLVKWLADYAYDVKLSRLWCNARKEAVKFYKERGMDETSEKFERNGHEYVVMEKVFK